MFCRLYSLPPLMLMLDAEMQAYDPRAREAQGRSGVQGQSGLYEILLKKRKKRLLLEDKIQDPSVFS